MKAPLKWLREYVDINVTPHEFSEALTMSGSKVEGIEVQGEEISNVVVGKILEAEKHPDADKLQVTKVDIGSEVIQIVTGATNIKVGDFIPAALHGALLPGGKKITRGKLRGVESNGMMCSISELNLTKNDFPNAAEDGIFILDKDELGEFKLGQDIKEIVGLNDTIVEFEITSNRPDCLSMLGISREVAVTLGTLLRKPLINVLQQADEATKHATVEIEAGDLCSRYAARIIKDVKIETSPKWLREKLRSAGVRPINNIVDITNYVMLELGQPMHAFDLDNVCGNKIVVRRSSEGEILKTLDDQERKLDSSMLVIADDQRPIAVAGVMGGANSEISSHTTTILLESATFNGTAVRLAAKKLSMRTEASARFEKGLDSENVITALDRAAQLIEMLGAGVVCKGVIDCYPSKAEAIKLNLRPDKINSLLGTNIETDKMIEILRRLEFDVNDKDMTITAPTFRLDIEMEADIAEEIARFYGYNNIKPTLLEGRAPTLGKKSYEQKVEDIIKNTMLSCGLSEAYTYSFTSPKVFDMINLPFDSELRKAVIISNPLGEDFSIMRTTTIPNMLEILSRNYNHRVDVAKMFELSKIYIPIEEKQLPNEELILTIGMYGQCDFYEIKGTLLELFEILGIESYEFEPEKNNNIFHPGRTAKVVINGNVAGVVGEIHPKVINNFDGADKTYVATLDVKQLVDTAILRAQYKALPKFPAVTRDIAILVSDEILVKQIEDIISQRAGKILEEIKLFDVYKGKQVPDGMKSVAYSITFRAEDKTLTDEDVNKSMTKILEGLKTGLNAQLRE